MSRLSLLSLTKSATANWLMPRALAATATATAVFFICSYSSFGFSSRVVTRLRAHPPVAFPPRHSGDIRNRPLPHGLGLVFHLPAAPFLGQASKPLRARQKLGSGLYDRNENCFEAYGRRIPPSQMANPFTVSPLSRCSLAPVSPTLATLLPRISPRFVASGQWSRAPADHRPVVAFWELPYTARLPSPGACSSP